jgi:hypothetical protein
MSIKNILLTLVIVISIQLNYADPGESTVITLILPYGARSTGMGEVGTALANDESVVYYNPAGLGIHNNRWKDLTISGFYEKLLPSIDTINAWHTSFVAIYQTRFLFGGIGIFSNYTDLGKHIYDKFDYQYGHIPDTFDSYERVVGIGWGIKPIKFSKTAINVGITFKFIKSALAPGYGENGEGIAHGFALDFGYLESFSNGLKVGLTLMNMGPQVYYIDKSSRNPLPFAINLALAYQNTFTFLEPITISLESESRLDKECISHNNDGFAYPFIKALIKDWPNHTFKEINYHSGIEVGLNNSLYFRNGFLIDIQGVRYEHTYGLGLNIFNHLTFDWSVIYAPKDYMKGIFDNKGASGARHKQMRWSLSLNNLLYWNESDYKWYRLPKE